MALDVVFVVLLHVRDRAGCIADILSDPLEEGSRFAVAIARLRKRSRDLLRRERVVLRRAERLADAALSEQAAATIEGIARRLQSTDESGRTWRQEPAHAVVCQAVGALANVALGSAQLGPNASEAFAEDFAVDVFVGHQSIIAPWSLLCQRFKFENLVFV